MLISRAALSRVGTRQPCFWFAVTQCRGDLGPIISRRHQSTANKNASRQTAEPSFTLQKKALEAYKSHPMTFYTFNPKYLQWTTHLEPNRGNVPFLSYEGIAFYFLTPWGAVVESFFGEKGNMGQTIPGMGNQTFDALNASQKVVVRPPGPPGLGLDDVWREFDNWMLKIEHSLHEHLQSNAANYPELGQEPTKILYRRNFAMKRRPHADVSEDGSAEDLQNEKPPTALQLTCGAKLFVHPIEAPRGEDLKTDTDKWVWEKHRLVRLDVALFESDGTLVPIQGRSLTPGDLVSMQIRLGVTIKPATPGKLPKVSIAAHMGSVVRLSEPSESVIKSQSDVPIRTSMGSKHVTETQSSTSVIGDARTQSNASVGGDAQRQSTGQTPMTKNQSKSSAKATSTSTVKKPASVIKSQPKSSKRNSMGIRPVTESQSNSVNGHVNSAAKNRPIARSPVTKNQSKPSVGSNIHESRSRSPKWKR
eukprot:comp5786_c0_seq1/m.1654 comp5786_c0_seq1/g.1654  ORF comp5786_c0_seq1/g.1654 comp5786_c0_seq1/m.1654 type:complete len:477 (-) comp5786_c0_seq1:99-1529(-)